jgi:hypothetical protein
MTTLAPKLPYDHPYAPGYPGYGSQHVPSDPDARDYLSRVAAADGAGVEVGIANAIEQFILGCKADSTWDAIQASCILCGARTLSGALVPLKTPYGPELVDINALPTPSITDASGSTGVWTPATRTMSNSSGTAVNAPSFVWSGYAATAGVQYRIAGKFSGDHSHVSRLSFGGTTVNYPAASSPDFSVAVTATTTGPLTIRLDSTLAPSSVTIESLSIREDTFTPTPYNFVEADYNRSGTPGLQGDGATKYLDTNRASDADPQDDVHLSVYATAISTGPMLSVFDGTASPVVGTQLAADGAGLFFTRCRTNQEHRTTTLTTGFAGQSRSSPAAYSKRNNGSTLNVTRASVSQQAANYFAFAHSDLGTPAFSGTGFRLAFYSIGSSLDLAALDTRTTNLVNGIKFHSLTGLLPNDYDPATIAYIVSGISAGGTL